MYNPASARAEEFIAHEEVLETLAYADRYKEDAAAARAILDKARLKKGLTHREASVLLACEIPEIAEELFALARQIKIEIYGNRIVMFAPLYLSNYCINGCVYCPYHKQNCTIPRKKLTQAEIADEVRALQDMGHKRLAIETGEDPVNNPIEYILESLQTIYSVKHKNGAIRRANVNIAATTVENYRRLKEAGIGTYILFQETYHKESYEQLHPTGPKHNYAYHTEAHDRAMQGGIDDVGLGVLFGLELYRYEFAALLMHAEHLEAAFGVGPHTISVPRIKPAADINPEDFSNGISDEIFAKLCACIRVAVPYTGMIISTRESEAVRAMCLPLGVSQISGASKTGVGGYADAEGMDSAHRAVHRVGTEQFDVSDNRTLDEVVRWLMELGYIPSFCTACYREGRTGDRFMQLAKTGQIQNCCHPNALMTLEEFLIDYASPETRRIGEALIASEINSIPNEKMRANVVRHLAQIQEGERDFRV
ncbi:MAG: [FeFe] hydrogenase H-cluster radical SAM maturase HydG [Oscillospiraceae bacterium]|jgi:2-iminoacetate synthase|nr:[FeFe] hydrogenase H-cluster radical SAM maturase HydG [Oscillospiraceae bacterium]